MKLTLPLFTTLSQEISSRDLILIGGGFFLIVKSTFEIHDKLEGEEGHRSSKGVCLLLKDSDNTFQKVTFILQRRFQFLLKC